MTPMKGVIWGFWCESGEKNVGVSSLSNHAGTQPAVMIGIPAPCDIQMVRLATCLVGRERRQFSVRES